MPLEFQQRLKTLLPWVSINPSVQNLAQSSRDPSGGFVYHGPVQNRPWEWTEFLGDNVIDHKGGDDESKVEIKNTTSLSFELFGAQATGDYLPQSSTGDRTEGTLRSLRTDLSTESVFKRDWRESRLHFEYAGLDNTNGGISRPGGGEDEPISAHSTVPLRLQARTDMLSSSFGVSPASSVRSRVSASSFRSPAQSVSRQGGSGEVIDVDSFSVSASTSGTSRAPKRKAAAMQPIDEDDEIQIIDNPTTASSSRSQKKPKVKAPTKARAKKR